MYKSFRDIRLTSEDWLALENLKEFLNIFAVSTKILSSSSKPTINYNEYIFKLLIKKIESYKNVDGLEGIVKAMIAKFNEIQEESFNEQHAIATLLDPRLKNRDYSLVFSKENSIRLLKGEFKFYYKNKKDTQNNQDGSIKKDLSVSPLAEFSQIFVTGTPIPFFFM